MTRVLYFRVPPEKLKKWQHYKDRDPPWIKLHRSLLHDYEYACLQDASKLHLIMIWLLASQCENHLPFDANYIAKQIGATEPVNLKLLLDNGFIEIDSKMLATCKQSGDRETETETETETELALIKSINACDKNQKDVFALLPPPGNSNKKNCPYQQIVAAYHEILGDLPIVRAMNATRKSYIKQRWQEKPDLNYWREYFEHVSESDFLMGRTQPKNGHHVFIADFDWLMRPNNYVHIIEGKYHV